MSLYQLPKFEIPKLKAPNLKFPRWVFVLILIVFLFSFLAGIIFNGYFYSEIKEYLSNLNIKLPEPKIVEKVIEKETVYLPQTSQEEAIISVVNESSPAVISIIITKDLPVLEEYYIRPFEEFPFEIPQYRQKGVEKKEIGGGTGFIISEDGMILTNAHVVLDKEADYTVLTNDGKKIPAKVLARDSFRDLAIIKIETEKSVDNEGRVASKSFPVVKMGNSDKLQIGQTVIAIGNALGEFRNTVSVGVISGLGRKVTASGEGITQTLEDVIQTDAAINKGNSGGPLLNLKGEVIGVNFAMAEQAENIGFAIPINHAKKIVDQVKTSGKFVYPFLGVKYILINEKNQKDNDLPVNYGAWVIKGEASISPGSAAEKAGIKEGDIILEFNQEKITTENSLAKLIMKYNPGDKVVLKILREGKENLIQVTLGEKNEEM